MITVIVPTYRGADRIATCLDDLAAQTLAPELFEVVVVQNGPPTETPRIVREWCERHPQHSVRLVETEVASAQNARNIVLDGPTREWITFVDDDDRLQPRYLEALWDAARPGLVPYARVGIVVEGALDRVDESSWLTAIPRQHLAGRGLSPAVTNAELWPAVNPAWAKLVERSVIGDVRFDTSIKYADDTVFWMEVLARSGARLTLTDFRDGSAYLWVQRDGSITRAGGDSWTTYVIHKLDAIAHMQRVVESSSDPATRSACASVCALFWTSVIQGVQRQREWLAPVREEIFARGLADVPWQALNEGAATELVISRGPLGDLPADRIVDLVTYGTAARVFTEDEAAVLGPVLDRHVSATGGVECAWPLVGAVLEHVRGVLPKLGGTERYASVRSVSSGPLEHLLAAMIKLIDPTVTWHASVTEEDGAARAAHGVPVEDDWVLAVLAGGLTEAGVTLETLPDMPGLARLLVSTLADVAVIAERPAGGGSTVAYVSSPLQALNLVEYCAATSTVPDLVIVGEASDDGNRLQTLAPLEALGDVPVHLQHITGGWIDLDQTAPEAIRELDGVLAPHAPIRRFVVGDYARPALWMMLNALGLSGDAVVVVDDGTGTLGIDRPAELDRFTGATPIKEGLDQRPPRSLTFFTTYADQIKAGPDDTVVVNERAVLRARYRDIAFDDNLVFVVGSPLLEHGVVTSGDIELALELVQEARLWQPGATVAYLAHRWERPEKVEAISGACEVLAFEVPFELIPPQVGTCPRRLVGNFSSALGNLADLTDDRVQIRSFRVPAPLVAAEKRERVVHATEKPANQHPGSITVMDYSVLAEPV